jgi:hypothetical protein
MGGPFVRMLNPHMGVVSRKLVQSAMPPAAESPIAEISARSPLRCARSAQRLLMGGCGLTSHSERHLRRRIIER